MRRTTHKQAADRIRRLPATLPKASTADILRAVVEAPRTYPVRWKVTVRRCAAPSCPREALAFFVWCRECAPREVSRG